MRLSSKLTLLSKVLVLFLGIPISCVIAVETHYAIWGFAISLALICACVFFAIMTAELFKESDTLVFKKALQGNFSVAPHEIINVKLLRSSKHTYLWFATSKGNFLIIAPMWGDDREALLALHQSFQKA